MRKKNIFVSLLLLLFALVLMAGVVVLYSVQQNKSFINTFYTMSLDEVSQPIRIVSLTDLHNRQYGEENQVLVSRIAALKPDIIACVGDMTLKDTDDHTVVCTLLKQLTNIAPVYYAPGNHEYDEILFHSGSTLRSDIKETGAIYIDNAFEQIMVNGTAVSIGGVCKNKADILRYTVTRKMLAELSAQPGLTVLLSHYPEGFMDEQMAEYPFDLVLCGHAHGGQIRLPFGDGLYTKDQGFMPKFTSGMKSMSGSTVVISRGLGDSSSVLPRVNNQPELVVIDIE